MSDLSVLRDRVLERDGGCVWPGQNHDGSLQLAHLEHRGMGGSQERNREDNCVILCRCLHHDVFDGRVGVVKLRGELVGMLRVAAGLK